MVGLGTFQETRRGLGWGRRMVAEVLFVEAERDSDESIDVVSKVGASSLVSADALVLCSIVGVLLGSPSLRIGSIEGVAMLVLERERSWWGNEDSMVC